MEIKTKYNIGDRVIFINTFGDDDKNSKSWCELSFEVIESIEIRKDGVYYWIPGCDWAVKEDMLVIDDNVMLYAYLGKRLRVNKGE